MRLQRCFALSFCLLIASLGCSSKSGNTQQPAAPGQTATTAAGGSSAATTAAGTTSPATTGAAPANGIDACALLTSDEIKSVQGEAVLEAKPNRRTDSPFAVVQCFYMTPSFSKSVSLEVTQRGASDQSVREFWRGNFARVEEKREKKKNERGEIQGGPLAGESARPVKGIGDEAYWVSTNANSTLYAFKKETLLRLSIGGTDKEDARMKKIRTLAEKALARL